MVVNEEVEHGVDSKERRCQVLEEPVSIRDTLTNFVIVSLVVVRETSRLVLPNLFACVKH